MCKDIDWLTRTQDTQPRPIESTGFVTSV